MKVLIIEDEFLAALQLKAMVQECDAHIEVIDTLDSVESAVQWFRTHPSPDLLLADIELADGQSFAIFEQVDIKCPVIFTTAYDEFALQAFKVHSVDYLLKPVNEEALRKSLQKFYEFKKMYGTTSTSIDLKSLVNLLREPASPAQTYRDRFLLKQGSRLMPVEIKEIAYFFTRDRITFVKTWDNRSLIIDYHLDELERMLDPKLFYRANRQVIISPRSVSKIHLHFHNRLKLELTPVIEEEVYISREKATQFRTWMGE
jgi:two-component system LytT family response regulator